MAMLTVSGAMRPYLPGDTLELQGSTVGALLDELERRFPLVRKHLRSDHGALRPTFRVFVNGDDIRGLDGLETPLHPKDRVDVVPAIQGG